MLKIIISKPFRIALKEIENEDPRLDLDLHINKILLIHHNNRHFHPELDFTKKKPTLHEANINDILTGFATYNPESNLFILESGI